MKRIIQSHIYIIVLIASFGCSRDHHDHPDLTTGKELFDYHCAECHGKEGTGRLVDVTPANILTKKGRNEIIKFVMSSAEHDRSMPVFKTMPEREAGRIANHLMELKDIYNKSEKRKFRELLIEP